MHLSLSRMHTLFNESIMPVDKHNESMTPDMLLQQVRQHIDSFFSSDIDELFFNERDFQMHLALYLQQTQYYDDIEVEYYVPSSVLDGYLWESEIRIDIVVRKGDLFVPIELKYKTKQIHRRISRFGEKLNEQIQIVKNQSAQNIGKYAFWKDVKRIELLKDRFEHIPFGFAVFLTNEESYKKTSKRNTKCYAFTMADRQKSPHIKKWVNSDLKEKGYPSFQLKKEYEPHWKDIIIDGVPFHLCVLSIE